MSAAHAQILNGEQPPTPNPTFINLSKFVFLLIIWQWGKKWKIAYSCFRLH